MDYFRYFDLPADLIVDKAKLKKAYYARSREVHPDHQLGQDGHLEESAMNNEAYRVLLDRSRRLKYILIHFGGVDLEEKNSLDPTFLMEMMELNERVMGSDEEEVGSVRALLLDRDEKKFEELASGVPKEIGGFGKEDWEKVKKYYFQRQYLLRVINNLDNLASP